MATATLGGDWKFDAIADENRKIGFRHVRFLPAVESGGRAVAIARVKLPDWKCRLVAVGVDGATHRGDPPGVDSRAVGLGGGDDGWPRIWWGRFPLTVEQVDYFAVVGREIEWARFENVAAKPGNWSVPRAELVPGEKRSESGPVDQTLPGRVDLDAGPLVDVLATLGERGGFEVRANWGVWADKQTKPISLQDPTPLAAVRAVLESAGWREFTLLVDRDGEYVRARHGRSEPTFPDGRPPGLPGAGR